MCTYPNAGALFGQALDETTHAHVPKGVARKQQGLQRFVPAKAFHKNLHSVVVDQVAGKNGLLQGFVIFQGFGKVFHRFRICSTGNSIGGKCLLVRFLMYKMFTSQAPPSDTLEDIHSPTAHR